MGEFSSPPRRWQAYGSTGRGSAQFEQIARAPAVTDGEDVGVPECFICRKQASGDAQGVGVIYEDELVFASHVVQTDGASDAHLGYAFVETKRHVAGLGDLAPEESAAIGSLVNDVAGALRSSEEADYVYAHVYGDGVPHLHVHLQARYPATPRE